MNKKEKIKLISFILLSLITLYVAVYVGCWLASKYAVKNSTPMKNLIEAAREEIAATSIKEYPTANGRYKYIVDTTTGVVYLQYNGSGITVMYNADGTIVTADQMDLE